MGRDKAQDPTGITDDASVKGLEQHTDYERISEDTLDRQGPDKLSSCRHPSN